MKIVLVDDHPLVRKGLSFVLTHEMDIEIVGEASNSREAIELLNSIDPDIALIDLRLGNEYGISIIESCNHLKCRFIVLTSSMDEKDFRKSEEVGAWGYVLKDALPEELLYALRLVEKGRRYYDPGIINRVMNPLSNSINEKDLTPREQEVLIAISQGLSNKDISKTLFISEYTVKKHVSQILAKLELTDRTQAAIYVHSKDNKFSLV